VRHRNCRTFWRQKCGPGYLSRYNDWLRTGPSGDRIPVGSEIFRTRPDRPWGPPSFLYNGYRVFPRGKTAVAWRWPPTPSSAEVKERVKQYLYSTSGPSWALIGWTLPFPRSFLLEAESTPRAIVRPEGLCQWKIRMTPSGIETATFQLLAQLRYRVPRSIDGSTLKYVSFSSWIAQFKCQSV
jgi:hypothetical protein